MTVCGRPVLLTRLSAWEPEEGLTHWCPSGPVTGSGLEGAIVMACIEGAAGLGREDNLHLREGEGLQRWGNTGVCKAADGPVKTEARG